MPVRRIIAAKRDAAFLAGAQMHPCTMYFYTLFTNITVARVHFFYGAYMRTDLLGIHVNNFDR